MYMQFLSMTTTTTMLTPSYIVWGKKNNAEFPLTLFYRPDPTDFIGKLVDTELKGR